MPVTFEQIDSHQKIKVGWSIAWEPEHADTFVIPYKDFKRLDGSTLRESNYIVMGRDTDGMWFAEFPCAEVDVVTGRVLEWFSP